MATFSPNNQRPVAPLDDLDRRLVELLRTNARTPNSVLAEALGIAPSTCVTRVKSLVDRGVVSGFTATIEPRAVGLLLQALISVNIRAGQRHLMAAFSDQMQVLPDVVQLFFLGGSEDFILHVAVRDSEHVRDFVLDNLSAHPAVASTRTSMVFDHHYSGPAVAP
ncbi:MAG: Lrp/AsnC family transcriptional regulator [Burkholderiaceae bacterium]|nr:Lrp/AsnC family transcriptional regulator [Microbacteriaceae bacterium]